MTLRKLFNKVSNMFGGNNILLLFFVVVIGVIICRIIGTEGLSSGPYPGAFEQKLVAQKIDKSNVVGLVPEPNRTATSPSLIREVATLPDPDPKNFIRQDYEMDKNGSLKIIQNAPLVKPSVDEDDKLKFVRYNSVAPTGPVKM